MSFVFASRESMNCYKLAEEQTHDITEELDYLIVRSEYIPGIASLSP